MDFLFLTLIQIVFKFNLLSYITVETASTYLGNSVPRVSQLRNLRRRAFLDLASWAAFGAYFRSFRDSEAAKANSNIPITAMLTEMSDGLRKNQANFCCGECGEQVEVHNTTFLSFSLHFLHYSN